MMNMQIQEAKASQAYYSHTNRSYHEIAVDHAQFLNRYFSFTIDIQSGYGNWRPVRYVPLGSTTWHTAQDNLSGASHYGESLDPANKWSRQFTRLGSHPNPKYILFMSADFTEWVHADYDVVRSYVTSESVNSQLPVLATSRNITTGTVNMYSRANKASTGDPIIGLTTAFFPCMYAEDAATNLDPTRGSWVFVR